MLRELFCFADVETKDRKNTSLTYIDHDKFSQLVMPPLSNILYTHLNTTIHLKSTFHLIGLLHHAQGHSA